MKTTVITGTNKGIGLATAQLFLEHGWRVIGTYRQTVPPITSANFVPVNLDIADPHSIVSAAEMIRQTVEQVDALVNNSGVLLDGSDEIPDLAKIRQTFEVNVFGAIDFTEHLLPLLRDGGSIVNISSILGAFAFPIDDGSMLGYRMSKAAINMYTRSLAVRLKGEAVVSSIHPGWVKTDMGKSVADENSGPDREPADAANDIFNLVTTTTESGLFWNFGSKRAW